MFQFRRFPSYTYLIQYMMLYLLYSGLLHSDICGSILACNSPQLFAAYHVLRRLPMPRHPPCALISLTFFWLRLIGFAFSWSELCFSSLEVFYWNCSFATLSLKSIWNYNLVNFTFTFPHCIYFTSLFNFQDSIRWILLHHGGHKWTRTIDLTLIRRAL